MRAGGSRSRHGPEPTAAKRKNARAPYDVDNPRLCAGHVCVAVRRSRAEKLAEPMDGRSTFKWGEENGTGLNAESH